jgi:hypothetical protein
MKTAIQIAGLVQLSIAAANFLLPSLLQYRKNLAKVSPIIRQIFVIHSLYIVIVLVGFAIISLAFPNELAGASPLGRLISSLLAAFWLTRVAIQLAYYDPSIKRQHPLGHAAFTLASISLGITYLLAALA